MPSVTITVVDKQRGPRSERTGKYGPWKIAAGSGVTYKAWDDIAKDLYIGKPYDCRVEVVTRGEFTDTFIKHAVEAVEPKQASGSGINFPPGAPGSILVTSHPGGVIIDPPRNGPEHGMIVKESFARLAAGNSPAQILDWWVVAEEIYDQLKAGPKPEQANFPTEETF